MNVHSHNCPNCGELVEPRYSELVRTHKISWYVCTNDTCRHSFRCTAAANGSNRMVTAESSFTEREGKARIEAERAALATLRAPCCGGSWRVRDTWRDDKGHWRKHICRGDGKIFFSCVSPDGELTVHIKKPSKLQFEFD